MNVAIYRDEYREQVQSICMASFNGAPMMASAIRTVFCDSYLDITPNTCMVLLDESDHVFGYVLSASDYQEWAENQMDYLLENKADSLTIEMARGANSAMAKHSKKYPAHFHIQIKEEARGTGYGSMLLRCLEECVRNNNVNAIMCNVASSNPKALAFYLKNGYSELDRNEYELAMGKVLFGRKKR